MQRVPFADPNSHKKQKVRRIFSQHGGLIYVCFDASDSKHSVTHDVLMDVKFDNVKVVPTFEKGKSSHAHWKVLLAKTPCMHAELIGDHVVLTLSVASLQVMLNLPPSADWLR